MGKSPKYPSQSSNGPIKRHLITGPARLLSVSAAMRFFFLYFCFDGVFALLFSRALWGGGLAGGFFGLLASFREALLISPRVGFLHPLCFFAPFLLFLFGLVSTLVPPFCVRM